MRSARSGESSAKSAGQLEGLGMDTRIEVLAEVIRDHAKHHADLLCGGDKYHAYRRIENLCAEISEVIEQYRQDHTQEYEPVRRVSPCQYAAACVEEGSCADGCEARKAHVIHQSNTDSPIDFPPSACAPTTRRANVDNRYVYITPGMAESYALVLGQAIQKLSTLKEDKFLLGQLRSLKKELESGLQIVSIEAVADARRYQSIRATLLSGGPEWSKLAAMLNIAPDTATGVDDAVDATFGLRMHSYGENCQHCEGGYCLAFPNWSKPDGK